MARRQLTSPLLLVVSLVVLQVPWTTGKMTHTCNLLTVTSTQPAGKCGRLLLGTLELVCKIAKNQADWKIPITLAKTAASGGETRDIDGEGRGRKLRASLLTKRQAMSYLQRERRIWRRAADYEAGRAGKVRGFQSISCECCWNRCSLGEIMDHCGYL